MRQWEISPRPGKFPTNSGSRITSANYTPTLPETNIAPEKGLFQWEIHLPNINFQVRCYVSFREGNPCQTATASVLGTETPL